MYTYFISALIGVIISKCLYGKQFNEKLATVAITVLCFTFGGTLIVSSVFTNYLPTERIYTEKSKLLPITYYFFDKDTTVRFITVTKKGEKVGVTKADTVITRDSTPDYFYMDYKSGVITYHTNYDTDFQEEKYNWDDVSIVQIDTNSWYGIEKTRYITDGNKWVTDMSIPKIETKDILYLNKAQYAEFYRHVNEYRDKVKKEENEK